MLQLIKKHKLYFSLYSALFIGLSIILLTTSKADSFFWVNSNNSKLLDHIFFYWTSLGNGIIYLILIILFLVFLPVKYALMVIIAALLQTFFSSSLKELIFTDSYRPIKLLSDMVDNIHIVDNVDMHEYHSFPSGHTASAFTAYTLIALVFSRKFTSLLFFIIAAGVAYSRVYLAQHFVIDVWAGSIIGVFSATTIYWWVINSKSVFFNKEWMQKRLFK